VVTLPDITQVRRLAEILRLRGHAGPLYGPLVARREPIGWA